MAFNASRIWNFLVMIFFTAVLCYSTYLFYNDAKAGMADLDQYTGQIIDKGVITQRIETEDGNISFDVYYIRLKGLSQILATGNIAGNYEQLNNALAIGDRVKVYYRTSLGTDEPNMNLYQIEKSGEVILGHDELRQKRITAACICILGVVVITIVGILKDRKYWKRT